MKVNAYHNGDDVFIAWKPDGFIDDCRGFALLRKRNGVEETVSTWVGFEDDDAKDGERRASTDWPIQKYQWTDYMANPGDTVRYRVIPMIGPDKSNLRADTDNASDWTATITLDHQVSPKIEAYFNRGIVASQWVSRRLEDIVDAILYVGRKGTSAPIAPDLCADTAYIKMRLDRIALVDLPQGEADRVKRLCNVK